MEIKHSPKGRDAPRLRTDNAAPTLMHLLAAGEIVPAQAPATCLWSPEKALAAAVLATALVEIRDHAGNPKRRRLVAGELAWLRSDANDRLYAFRRVCELLNLDPQWVRETVEDWKAAERHGRPEFSWRAA